MQQPAARPARARVRRTGAERRQQRGGLLQALLALRARGAQRLAGHQHVRVRVPAGVPRSHMAGTPRVLTLPLLPMLSCMDEQRMRACGAAESLRAAARPLGARRGRGAHMSKKSEGSRSHSVSASHSTRSRPQAPTAAASSSRRRTISPNAPLPDRNTPARSATTHRRGTPLCCTSFLFYRLSNLLVTVTDGASATEPAG